MESVVEKTVIPVAQKRPAVNKRVIVVCKDFRCLGYLDREGVWRDAKGNTVQEVIGWFEVL